MKINPTFKKNTWFPSLIRMLDEAPRAAQGLSQLSSNKKNAVLNRVAQALNTDQKKILRENLKDLENAEKAGLSPAMIDRLRLNEKRLKAIAEGVQAVAKLPDPIGKVLSEWKRPNGLKISKVSVPLGVILLIYESRPNVTVECGALCLKSGNVAILRGGKEAFYTNQILVQIFRKVLKSHKLPLACVNFIETTDYEAVDFLLKRDHEINLVIPRGGEGLIRKVVEHSSIPVIKHYQGICHVYVDDRADLKKAVHIAYNAKMQRPGVCNAMETLLVNEKIAPKFLPILGEKLKNGGCEVRADSKTRKWLPWAREAAEGDFGHEFLDKILAVKIVKSVDEAIGHIQRYGSSHTDAIVTENKAHAKLFVGKVDSSSVMVNASTRFSDGFEFGFGAEIGISTDKIHARGPMGLEGLTSYKYIVQGNGQTRG